MRFVGRVSEIPTSLAQGGERATQRAIAAVSSGEEKISFSGAVYASDSVRTSLDLTHLGKCAFCEGLPLPVSTAQVEHFRPKGAYIHSDTGATCKPGYYKLAYVWSNLLLACSRCNGSFKGNHFPLLNEASRSVHTDSPVGESPLLIDPATERPRNYIRFRGAVAYAVDGNARGECTIAVLGLNREDLVDARNQHLEDVGRLIDVALRLPDGDLKNDVLTRLAEYRSPKGSFLSCLADYFDFICPEPEVEAGAA